MTGRISRALPPVIERSGFLIESLIDMLRRINRSFIAGLSLCLACSIPGFAQPNEGATRTSEQTRLQSEKALQLKPMTENKAEQVLDKVEKTGLLGGAPRGLYPWFGSILGGGGVSLGAGYRVQFAD